MAGPATMGHADVAGPVPPVPTLIASLATPAAVALAAAQWATGTWLLWRLSGPTVAPESAPGCSAERVSVIIPARDEECSLPGLLESLAAQRRPPDQLIVVDDHSTDRTRAVAEAAGATVIANADLPTGWTGKTWACAQGAAAATGDTLVFLDADVTLSPDAVEALLAERRRRGGLVSVEPFHETRHPYERLSAVCNVVSLMGTGAFTGWPHRPVTMAFGPCLAVSRADYDLAGGHADPSVRARVAEDIALARQVRQVGRPVSVLAGRDLIRFQMYPGGVRQLTQGWTKALAAGAWSTSPGLAVAVFFWMWGALVAAWDGITWAGSGGQGPLRAGIYAAWAAQSMWMLRRVGRFGLLTSLLFPLPLLAFLIFLARSGWSLLFRRPVRWRGRTVSSR